MRPVAHPSLPGWRTEAIETLRLSGPLVLANLLQMLTFAIDIIFVARLGPESLAASALAFSVLGLLVWALHGLAGAATPIMAAELGARAPALRPVRRTTRMALWVAVGSGVLAMALCVSTGPFMLWTGQAPEVVALSMIYMQILVFSIVPMLIAGVLRNFVATLGRPGLATAITALGVIINALADWLLIFGNWGAPALGLQGAALATVITAFAIVAFYLLAIFSDPRLARYHILGFLWRADWARLKEILRVGAPIFVTIAAEAGIFGAAAFIMGRIGTLELAAHTLAIQIAAMAFQVPMGMSQAATIRVGYFHGAGLAEGVHRSGWTAIAITLAVMVFTAAAMLAIPHSLLSIYIDVRDPANASLVELATSLLAIAAAFQLVDGLQAVAAGTLRGLKDTSVPMRIALFSYWIPGFGTAIVLGLGSSLAGTGVWLGLSAGLATASALLTVRWHCRERLGLLAPPALPHI